MMRFWVVLLCLLPWSAHAIELGMPVKCAMGKDCVVQNYVDHEAGEGYRDFKCRHLSYDGHKGTDIRAMNRKVMAKGIPVLAVADGVVLGMRDSVDDLAPVVENLECGNGVRIAHTRGWVTQYCHMRKGSLRVRSDEVVRQGQQLGLMGMSGDTGFPHVHLSVEHDGVVIDPYTGTGMRDACGQAENPLWSAQAQQQLAYHESGILGAGFSNHKPTLEELQEGLHQSAVLPSSEPLLLFWAEFYGLQKDDAVYLALQNPQGVVQREYSTIMERSRAIQYYPVGKRLAAGWPAGHYTGVLRVTRAGEVLLEKQYTVQVTDEN